MSQAHQADATLFRVVNRHSAACGTPPHIERASLNHYLGYFENEHGEQAVFVYDRASRMAVLYTGDAGWETAHSVVNGTVPGLLLPDPERLWLRACWQAATGTRQGAS